MAGYLRYADLMAALGRLGAGRLLRLGVSREGRDIPLVAFGSDDQPAILVEANTHAGEVTGSAAALALCRRLAEDPEAAAGRTVYVVPRLAVDGAEVYLSSPEMPRSAALPYPWPVPAPGLQPCDLDGDGLIRLMRRQDPVGEWRGDPRDPRLLVRRRPDDREGPFYRVTPEGLYRDWDGRALAEWASPYGLDFNRNYPVNWRPEGAQPGGGRFPLSQPETRALAEFVVAHENLCALLSLHTAGGIILRPPAEGGDERLPEVDRALLQGLGDAGERLTGYPCRSTEEAFNAGSGRPTVKGVDDWAYEHRGLVAYTMELWDLDARAGIRGYAQVGVGGLLRRSEEDLARDELARLAWNDRVLGGAGFLPWRPFEHPQLGAVEIGGWDPKFVRQNPPPALLPEECRRAVDFALCLARATPRLSLGPARVDALGPGTYRVRAHVRNEGYLPTSATRVAVESRITRPVRVALELPPGAAVRDGPPEREVGEIDGYGCARPGPWGPPAQADSERWVDFVVTAPPGGRVRLRAEHARAGTAVAEVVLP
jgi:hypothetical protein